MQTKNAQLDKAQREVEQARQQMLRYEREIETLKSQLTKARLIQDNQSILDSPSLPRRSLSPRKSPTYGSGNRSVAEKENHYDSQATKSLMNSRTPSTTDVVGSRTPVGGAIGSNNIDGGVADPNGSLAGGASNWKNAADLTARLRERIESMKRAERQV